jgi:DNA mismatch endonuclease (patch repair protein)
MARRLPPAPPTDPETRVRMQRMPRRDTKPEMALRRVLHRRGLRYRVSVRPLRGLRCQADVVFTRARVAVFVDSCLFHSCPKHLRLPKTNTDWWRQKLAWTQERDARNNAALAEAGWTVIRVWEHEDPAEAADRIEAALRRSATGVFTPEAGATPARVSARRRPVP